MFLRNRPFNAVVKRIALGTDCLDSISGPVKSDKVLPTARHRCDVSSELCYPHAKLPRSVPILAARFGA